MRVSVKRQVWDLRRAVRRGLVESSIGVRESRLELLLMDLMKLVWS